MMSRTLSRLWVWCVVMALLAPRAIAQTQTFDVLITGAKVMDGTGNPWYNADLGIVGDRIVAVGRLAGSQARRMIDGRGKVVVPGFIDLHSHADDPHFGPKGLRSDDDQRRAAPNLVMQGITTVVVNADGRSVWPIAAQKADLEQRLFGPNTILLVGHGTVRRQVMGNDFRRAATPDEVGQMQALVRQAMEEGAYGMSAGLEYTPGRWSETDEVVALVEEIVPSGGAYIAHERSEGPDPMWYWPSRESGRPPSLLDAVQETIEIGERTGATVVASHIKAKGAHYWGSAAVVTRLINDARARGVAVYADQYPYNTTGSDGNTVLIPRWAFRLPGEGVDPDLTVLGESRGNRNFARALRQTLGDNASGAQVREDIAHEIRRRGGADRLTVMQHPDPAVVGKTLAALAASRGVTPVEMAIVLQLEGDSTRRGGAEIRGFSLSEIDIEEYARQPWTATATDGWIVLPEDGLTHTRVYGSFPRKIHYYAMERRIMTVEDAVRSATSLPAQIMGLPDRGRIEEGYIADVVVLDLAELKDNATFFEPHQYPSGVEFVLVNGQFVVAAGQPTWALPGRVVTPPKRGREATGGR